jgi:hypothetical protein
MKKLVRVGANDKSIHFASYHTLLERVGLTSGVLLIK